MRIESPRTNYLRATGWLWVVVALGCGAEGTDAGPTGDQEEPKVEARLDAGARTLDAAPRAADSATQVSDGAVAPPRAADAASGIPAPARPRPIDGGALTGVITGGNGIALAGVRLADLGLRALYPTHQDYVDRVTRSVRAMVDAGFALPEDEQTMIAQAMSALVP